MALHECRTCRRRVPDLPFSNQYAAFYIRRWKQYFMKRTIIMNTNTLLATAAALLVGLGIGWFAAPKMNTGEMDHSMMMEMSKPKGDQGPASMAFAKANADMHTGMDIEFSGNADVDFAKGMIPHHQGAVEMAKIMLEHGKDAQLRKLAEGIIAAQETEIKFMTDWLETNTK
jgi:hypothetical protein